MLVVKAEQSDDDHMDALRRSARAMFARHWKTDDFAKNVSDPDVWRALWRVAAAQGWLSIGQKDGFGGLLELMLLMEETGRAGAALPLAPCLLLNRLASEINHAELSACAEAVSKGEQSLAVASLQENTGSLARDNASGQLRISGRVDFVEALPPGAVPAVLLLIDQANDAIIFVKESHAGISIIETPGFSMPALQRWRLDEAPALEIKSSGVNGSALFRLAGMKRALGSGQRVFELAVDWAKEREQFGRPIGAFQAVQHKLANCAISLNASRELIERAVEAYDANTGDWCEYEASATAYASSALRQVSLEAQHVFAGVGYFEEHEAPRHFRRIHADTIRFGGGDEAADNFGAIVIKRGGLPDIDLGASGNAFRKDVRQFLEENLPQSYMPTPGHGPTSETEAFCVKLVDRGWTGLGWPKAVGGMGLSAAEQYAFAEEIAYKSAPVGMTSGGESLIGPTLLQFGSDEQKREFIPLILAKKVTFCLGYSEPSAGSDLASLRTHAKKVEGGWRVNGSKLYTTGGEYADYVFLAARTDPEAKPHHGISIFLVLMNSEGIDVRPMDALHGGTACAVYYDDVFVPDNALVGPLNQGWTVLSSALAHERVFMGASVAMVRASFDQLISELKRKYGGCDALTGNALIRRRIGAFAAEIEAARLLAVACVRKADAGAGAAALVDAAMSKCVTGEMMESVNELALDLLGPAAALSDGAEGAILHGAFERNLRLAIMYVIGGGTNEIQRNIIATMGLGLPRK